MIRFSIDDGMPVCIAEMKGYGFYLDNDSLIPHGQGVSPTSAPIC